MKMWGSWNLKELVFWNWLVRIIPQTRFIGVSASGDRVVTDGENWAPGRRLWLSGKHMFIYGRQPPLSSQSCRVGSGPRVPDLLSFQEKKMSHLVVKFLTFRNWPSLKTNKNQNNKYTYVSQTKPICGRSLFCELPFAASQLFHMFQLGAQQLVNSATHRCLCYGANG